jgi:TPR repeat protein
LTSQRYAVLKLFSDYKVELVTDAKGTTRKHIDYTANDLDSLRERAEYADAIAQTKLSELYYTGKQGAPLDRVKAYKWAFIASTKTNRQAKALLGEYEIFFTPEEISKGKAAADAFLKSTNMISK